MRSFIALASLISASVAIDKYLNGAGRYEDGLASVDAADAWVDELQAVAVGAKLNGQVANAAGVGNDVRPGERAR